MPIPPRKLLTVAPPVDTSLNVQAPNPSTAGTNGNGSGGTTTAKPTNQIPVSPQAPNDIQAGVANPDGILKGWKPVPNPMGDLFQGTYHFTFYLDTDLDSQNGNGNGKDIFVIAQTGLTGMNIQDVKIETFIGPNIRTRNANATNIEIKIYEPFGSQLPDLLFQAAVQQSIRNYLKAPWFLKLRLHGYDDQGKPVDIGNGWLWRMTLIDIQSQISENGSLHTITAMPISEQALNNQYCMIPDSINQSGSTVGEVLKGMVKAMNENVKVKYGDSHPPFIEFVVDCRKYPYDNKVGVATPFDLKITGSVPTVTNQRSSDSHEVQNSQFAPGSDIPAIIDSLMARSDEAVRMARLSRELPPQTGTDDEPNIADVNSIFHRVDTKVEFLSYDDTLGDYCKRITYTIVPYSSLRILTSMGRAKSFDKDTTLNKKKVAHSIDRALMKKQYDYIFTGLNTEVEKFDINVNFRWAVSVPVLQGMVNTGTAAQTDPSKVAANLQAQQTRDTAALAQVNDQLKTLDANRAATAKAQNVQDPTTIQEDAQTAALRTSLVQQQQQLTQTTASNATVLGASKDKSNAIANAKIAAARHARPPGPIIDGEDIVYENAQTGGNGFNGAGRGGSSYLPITIVQDADSPSTSTRVGTSSDNNANKSVYGALLNQLYGSTDGNLASLDLDIRGDPYWLGPGNNGQIYDTPSNDTTPNFSNGEHMFVFRFKLPLGYDANTKAVSVNAGSSDARGPKGSAGGGGSSNIVTGFYATTTVTNNFREGKFFQTLHAVRIQGWDFENILEGRENTVDTSTTYNNPSNTSHGNGSGKGSSRPISGSLTDQQLLASTMVAEAGNQGANGMLAVGNVIKNRIDTGRGPGSTVASVIMAPKQFSCWNNVDPTTYTANIQDTSTYNTAYGLAGQILSGSAPDNTNGATSYYNPALASPIWGNAGTTTAVIKDHKFVKGV